MPKTITVECPHCENRFTTNDIGDRVACPDCDETFDRFPNKVAGAESSYAAEGLVFNERAFPIIVGRHAAQYAIRKRREEPNLYPPVAFNPEDSGVVV